MSLLFCVKAHMLLPLSLRGRARKNISSPLRETTAIMANDNCSADLLHSMTSGSCGFTIPFLCQGDPADLYSIHIHKSLWLGRHCIMWWPWEGGHYILRQTLSRYLTHTHRIFTRPNFFFVREMFRDYV